MSGSDVKASAKTLLKGSVPRRLLTIVGLVLLMVYIYSSKLQIVLLQFLFPLEEQFTHTRLTLLEMTLSHIGLTLIASVLSALIGLSLGFAVSHGRGRYFAEIVQRVNSFVQTFPPAAVVILAFPFLGFGWPPTLLALLLYSLFPVLGNTIIGFYSVPRDVIDAASGLGMTGRQRVWIVELPLALPMIITGLRHAVILNIGTATIAAVIGGGGLGTIIISGLTMQNSALVLSGTIVITGLALSADAFFSFFDRFLFDRN